MTAQQAQATEREPTGYEHSLVEDMLGHTSRIQQMDREIARCDEEIAIRRQMIASMRETRRFHVKRYEKVKRKLAEENRLLAERRRSA